MHADDAPRCAALPSKSFVWWMRVRESAADMRLIRRTSVRARSCCWQVTTRCVGAQVSRCRAIKTDAATATASRSRLPGAAGLDGARGAYARPKRIGKLIGARTIVGGAASREHGVGGMNRRRRGCRGARWVPSFRRNRNKRIHATTRRHQNFMHRIDRPRPASQCVPISVVLAVTSYILAGL